MLQKASREEMSGATERWKQLNRSKNGKTWTYVRIKTMSVPGLREDGTLDEQHPLDATFVLYPAGTHSSGATSFWGHDHNVGATLTTGTKLLDEGVDDLEAITDDISSKDFALVEYSGNAFRFDDAEWTNTVFFPSSNNLGFADISKLKALVEQVAMSVSDSTNPSFLHSKRGIVASVRVGDGQDLIILFKKDARTKGHLVGVALALDAAHVTNSVTARSYLENHVAGGGRLYLFGDLPKQSAEQSAFDLEQQAADLQFDIVRRPASIRSHLTSVDSALDRLSKRPIKASTTSLVNGLPETKQQLQSMGFPDASLPGWQGLHSKVEQTLNGHWSKRITSTAEFIDELQNGSSDVILLVAHSDGKRLFIGDDSISLTDLSKLPVRKRDPSRPRIAVLVSCHAVNFKPSVQTGLSISGLFRPQASESLAAILVNKGYFDSVFAPDYEIDGANALSVLRESIAKLSVSLGSPVKGLSKVARLEQGAGEGGRDGGRSDSTLLYESRFSLD
jgi:hypothetical protein